jgi:quercetin dioxygenase-like cupin family protein
MSDNIATLSEIDPIQVWDRIRARRVEGERITLAIVELEPNAVAPEHRHPHEQLGLVIRGEMRFRVGTEERRIGPGGTWRILGDIPHEATAGPDGAVVIDVFNPIRDDWNDHQVIEGATPVWPQA